MIRHVLRALNRLPVPLTMDHVRENPGLMLDLDSPRAWDESRRVEHALAMPESRAAWLHMVDVKCGVCGRPWVTDGNDERMPERAAVVCNLMDAWRTRRVLSVGCGVAGLEHNICSRRPLTEMYLTDYAPQTVQRLREFFVGAAGVSEMDLTRPDWSVVSDKHDAVVLMYRVDPHLSDDQWRACFDSAWTANVRRILFIPNQCLTMLQVMKTLRDRVWWALTRSRTVNAGYRRTAQRFVSLWTRFYETTVYACAGKTLFVLERRRS